jgi:hypothetical protein
LAKRLCSIVYRPRSTVSFRSVDAGVDWVWRGAPHAGQNIPFGGSAVWHFWQTFVMKVDSTFGLWSHQWLTIHWLWVIRGNLRRPVHHSHCLCHRMFRFGVNLLWRHSEVLCHWSCTRVCRWCGIRLVRRYSFCLWRAILRRFGHHSRCLCHHILRPQVLCLRCSFPIFCLSDRFASLRCTLLRRCHTFVWFRGCIYILLRVCDRSFHRKK